MEIDPGKIKGERGRVCVYLPPPPHRLFYSKKCLDVKEGAAGHEHERKQNLACPFKIFKF